WEPAVQWRLPVVVGSLAGPWVPAPSHAARPGAGSLASQELSVKAQKQFSSFHPSIRLQVQPVCPAAALSHTGHAPAPFEFTQRAAKPPDVPPHLHVSMKHVNCKALLGRPFRPHLSRRKSS